MSSVSDLDDALRDNVAPDHMLRDIMDSEARFLARHGDTLLLMIRLSSGLEALEMGLSVAEQSPAARVQPSIRVMGLETQVLLDEELADADLAAASTLTARVERLRWLIGKGRYYVVPLRKRTDDATFADRISVGRSSSKDIVLRNPSVSKFHAWFEMDDTRSLYVADAESTNRTHLNGTKLEPRELTRVQSGDHLRIGSIDCIPCDPAELWRALRP